MVDPSNTSSYVQEPDNMVSDPSSNSEDANSTTSSCNCKEQCQPKKIKKRRRKINRIIKYVAGFSFVRKLKMNEKSHKQRKKNDDDKINVPTTTIHKPKCHDVDADVSHQTYQYQPPKASPSTHHYYSSFSSPFRSYNPTSTSPQPNEEPAMATSSTKRLFGFVGMHHLMLMIILAALVLSGKACAIFATIVWLVLLPLTSRFTNGRRPRWAQLGRSLVRQEVHGSAFIDRVWVPTTSF